VIRYDPLCAGRLYVNTYSKEISGAIRDPPSFQ
jgi:hypothetical protein